MIIGQFCIFAPIVS